MVNDTLYPMPGNETLSGPAQFFLGYPNEILGGIFGPGILSFIFVASFLILLKSTNARQAYGASSFITFLIATVMSPIAFNGLYLIPNNVWIITLVMMVVGVVWNRPTGGITK